MDTVDVGLLLINRDGTYQSMNRRHGDFMHLAFAGRRYELSTTPLADRGGRELPIHADIVGRRIDVESGDYVDVLVQELDARDAVVVMKPGPEA